MTDHLSIPTLVESSDLCYVMRKLPLTLGAQDNGRKMGTATYTISGARCFDRTSALPAPCQQSRGTPPPPVALDVLPTTRRPRRTPPHGSEIWATAIATRSSRSTTPEYKVETSDITPAALPSPNPPDLSDLFIILSMDHGTNEPVPPGSFNGPLCTRRSPAGCGDEVPAWRVRKFCTLVLTYLR